MLFQDILLKGTDLAAVEELLCNRSKQRFACQDFLALSDLRRNMLRVDHAKEIQIFFPLLPSVSGSCALRKSRDRVRNRGDKRIYTNVLFRVPL